MDWKAIFLTASSFATRRCGAMGWRYALLSSQNLRGVSERLCPCLRISSMKTSKQTQKQNGAATRRAAGRVWRDGRTGLILRETPTSDYEHRLNGAMGKVIRRWRLRYGFSGYEVALRAKISRQTLTDVETGDVWFSHNLAARICDAMGLRFSDACAAAERLRVGFSERKRRL